MKFYFLPLLVLVSLADFSARGQTPAPAPRPSAPGAAGRGQVRITVTFAAPPARATAVVAPVLYNKTRVLQFEEDDSPRSVFTDLYPLLRGGVASNGQTYPGLRFSDGCGSLRPWTAAVAINGHNTYNNSEWLAPGPQHDAGRLVWAQAQELLDQGWDIENHSDRHSADNPAQQLATLDKLIGERLKGYRPVVCIVPTNHAGYATAAFAAGYLAVSSAGQGDGYPLLNRYDSKRVRLADLPATPFVYRRFNADAHREEASDAWLGRLKAVSEALMAPGASPANVYVQRIFAHRISFPVLSEWLSYTQRIAEDRLWVTTLREFEEYRRVSAQVVKAETLRGSTLTINLSYAGVKANTRFQNLTLLVDSPGRITSIKVQGADSATYNLATGQVNVFRSVKL